MANNRFWRTARPVGAPIRSTCKALIESISTWRQMYAIETHRVHLGAVTICTLWCSSRTIREPRQYRNCNRDCNHQVANPGNWGRLTVLEIKCLQRLATRCDQTHGTQNPALFTGHESSSLSSSTIEISQIYARQLDDRGRLRLT